MQARRRVVGAVLTTTLAGCIPPGIPPAPPSPLPVDGGPVPTEAARPLPPVADERPTWEARAVAPVAKLVPAQTVTVRRGETLAIIGARTGAGADAIARANGLAPPYRVKPGQRLIVPGGRYHLVRVGETGIGIARAYGVPWSRFIAENGLVEPYVLRAQQRVRIPSGEPTLADRAAAFTLDIDEIVTGGEPAIADTARRPRVIRASTQLTPSALALAPPARLSGGFRWPAEGRLVGRFGPGASGERNNGVNLAMPVGTPVRAAADGVVAYAGEEIASLGDVLIIKHGDRWTSVYANASKLLVKRGDLVTRGQTVALSGQSGAADRPQLHFELRKGRAPVDPLAQLPAR